jgi:hypothetical protein
MRIERGEQVARLVALVGDESCRVEIVGIMGSWLIEARNDANTSSWALANIFGLKGQHVKAQGNAGDALGCMHYAPFGAAEGGLRRDRLLNLHPLSRRTSSFRW